MKASGGRDGTALSIGGRVARNNRLMGVGGATLAVTMIGLTYAAAPFYSAFCRATGYEGTPQVVKANTDLEGHRILRVGFDANVAPGLDWSFEPEVELGPAPHRPDRNRLFSRPQPPRHPGRGPRHFQRVA